MISLKLICLLGSLVGCLSQEFRLLDHGEIAASAGIVEVFNGMPGGEWGMICDDSFEQVDGDAICRFLGYPDAAEIFIGASGYEDSTSIAAFGAYEGPIVLDDMACPEGAASLADCYGGTVPWGENNCVNGEAVAVRCNLNIRLIANDAPAARAGIVEVRNNDEWGMVCDDAFAQVDGDAVCRMLGFASGAVDIFIGASGYEESTSIAAFGAYNGSILLDDMACAEDSASLADCYGGTVPWGSHNCRNVEAVGVSCMCDMPCFAAHAGAHISNGEPAGGIMSLCDCQDLCQASDTCIGFDFNAESEPYGGSSCWLHSVAGDLVAPYMDVTHYANVC